MEKTKIFCNLQDAQREAYLQFQNRDKVIKKQEKTELIFNPTAFDPSIIQKEDKLVDEAEPDPEDKNEELMEQMEEETKRNQKLATKLEERLLSIQRLRNVKQKLSELGEKL